jgi:ParB family chromosome partitioning protein
MELLPDLTDTADALLYWSDSQPAHPAVASYVAGFLASKKISNKESRALMEIDKVYTMTHFRRLGTSLPRSCLELWLNNPGKITMGHSRAIASLKADEREKRMRDLLVKKQTVRDIESLANGESVQRDADIDSLQRSMGEAIGYPITIKWSRDKRVGSLSIRFFSLDNLDDLGKRLGYQPDDY